MLTDEVVTLSTKTILLIDDEVYVREMIELCLQDVAGWNVIIADSLLEGLHKAGLKHPDAIVIDLSMYSIDSFKFLSKLKNHPETQAIPIVLLSVGVQWLDTKFLQQYQITGVIPKPFNPLKLHIQIAKILGWDS
ncbi:two-component response regulator [Nostoc carneum NIES-2107]|nr:two-component response regulator [Nostoc carneum NIES-2107]